MSVENALSVASSEFDKAVVHLKNEFARLQVGRASAALVESAFVEMYGVTQPLKAVANVSVPDAVTIQISPWDKNALGPIEKAIVALGTGLNPVNDGVNVRISVPPLTEERRTELVKHVKKMAEDARISVRTARQEAHNVFKRLKGDSEITEDDLYYDDKQLQNKVEAINKQIDDIATAKERDVMTI